MSWWRCLRGITEPALVLGGLATLLTAAAAQETPGNRWDHEFKSPNQLPAPLAADPFAAHKSALWKREVYLAGHVVFGTHSVTHLARRPNGVWSECAPEFSSCRNRLLERKQVEPPVGDGLRYDRFLGASPYA